MKQQNLILGLVLVIAAATGAHAGGPGTAFHAIADADFLDSEMDRSPDTGRSYVPAADAILDADLIDVELDRATDAGRSVGLAFDPILDADIGEGAGTSRPCTAANAVAVR